MAAVLVLTLGLVVAAVFWTSNEANEIAAENRRAQVERAIADELNLNVRRLGNMTALGSLSPQALTKPDPDVAEAVSAAIHRLGFNVVGFATWQGQVLKSWHRPGIDAETIADLPQLIRPATADLDNMLADLTRVDEKRRELPKHFGRARLFQQNGQTIIAIVVPAAPVANADVAVAFAVQVWDQSTLENIGNGLNIGSLKIEPEKPLGPSLPVLDTNNNIAAYVTWPPDRPGDLIRSRLVPMTLIVVIALFIFSAFAVARVQRVALSLAQSEERAQRMAGLDALSGLPNRLIFSDRLERELTRMARGGEGLAVMFLDLDRFKDVNDTYGHEAGDELIKEVARRLSDLLRGADTLARFGGDEFAIIQTGVKNIRDAEALARRILDAITHPFDVPGGSVTVGISIGVSLAPTNGEERETLMRLADTALYQAKNEGRNRYSFFQRQMDEALKLRKIVEDDLRNAIASDEMMLYYQPVVSADGETIVGVEALVRWPHMRHGLISPGQFISIAEERGLIIPLGEWVLRRACEDAKRWPNLKVAVNVSPIQFRHKDFVASVTRVVERSGIDPTRLEIELTEGVVVDDADAAEVAMMELRALGVRLALDDFGTGYSSLIYLRRFAFDKIKIDRSFLESMEPTGESAILVHSVVHLGRALGLTVTAEGVETKEQHRFLQAVGCHELQGYLFSKPVPPDDIDRMLEMPSKRATAA
jgi:diguanylate cyclase (GGDEF)-like protein